MADTIVVLVNGEVLADGGGSAIPDQRRSAMNLAESLLPLFASKLNVAVLHGNKPQVGFVLFRSEVASHILHPIPLDVCGADTQGATGYMLSQAFMNAMKKEDVHRKVMCVLTQTRVDTSHLQSEYPVKAIGPWFDRDKAEQYRQSRGWTMVEEPGQGYRRAVPLLPASEILEIEGIKQLVASGMVVIAAGGGGVPVGCNPDGTLSGLEAVIETEHVARMVAQELEARVLLMVIEKDSKFILSRLSTEIASHLTLEELQLILKNETFSSSSVQAKLWAAAEFLQNGGEQVVITTLRSLPAALEGKSGLRIGSAAPLRELLGLVGG
ncbi:MAG: hypothetical protein M1281_05735 [Chloroflexi bacterium]|nr:hypothetical protein [Chloroflexota bacterium]